MEPRWHNGPFPTVRATEQGVGPSSTCSARRTRATRETAMNRRMRHVFLVTALTAALGLVWGMGDEEVGGDGIDLRHVERTPRGAELDPGPMNMDSVPGLAALYGAVADFADVEEATAAGYAPSSDCMAGDFGAQGIHYAKDALFVPSVVLETA